MVTHNIDLQYRARDWQRQIHQALGAKRFCLCISHRRSGKTVAARMELIHRALEKPRFEGAYIAPFLSQARRVFWGQLKETAIKIPGTDVKETEMLVTFPNKSTIRCLGADSADGIRGMGFDYVAGDEMADWDPDVLQQVVMPTLAGRNGGLLLIGTPKGVDPLSEMYDRVRHEEDWARFLFTVEDTKVFTEKELRVMQGNMLPRLYALEYMCRFDAGTPDTLISGEEVDESEKRVVRDYEIEDHAVVLGVDVARFGDDRTVIVRRQGPKMFEPIVMKGANTIEIAKAVCDEFYRNPKADGIFLDYSAGLGGGVADQLEAMGLKPICVHFNGKPRNSRFANTRAEMWWEMCDWIRNVGTIPFIKGFKTELSSPKYDKDNNDRLIMESKEKIKGRGLNSPDVADALALTFYMPVMKGSLSFNDVKNHKAPEWDPWKDE